ncbi:hypothetical protein GCM10010442_80220 [Kitasatospora kifunensis]
MICTTEGSTLAITCWYSVCSWLVTEGEALAPVEEDAEDEDEEPLVQPLTASTTQSAIAPGPASRTATALGPVGREPVGIGRV